MRLLGAAVCSGPSEAELQPRQVVAPDGKVDARRLAALKIPDELLLRMYRGMLMVRIMDERLLTMQRQGRLIDHDQDGSMEQKKREGYF